MKGYQMIEKLIQLATSLSGRLVIYPNGRFLVPDAPAAEYDPYSGPCFETRASTAEK